MLCQDLPVEVWLEIIDYLNIGDLLVYNKVCEQLHRGSSGSKLVKKFLITAQL